ncbi:MAG: PqqD family protein [Candidatus Aminicenantaceae bacterium]
MDLTVMCYKKESDFVTRNIKGETIIVPVKGHVSDLDSIYTLDEVGTFIWQLLDGQTSIKQIVKNVCNEYDISPEEAEKDIIELVGSLENAGLIHALANNQRE